MEPVPETERMEEFKSSPLPTLRLQNPQSIFTTDTDPAKKPQNLRRSTEPPPSSPRSPTWFSSTALPYRPRTTSPLSGSHARSRSTASMAPPMSRTQSLPGVNGAGHILYSPMMRPASPSGSPSPSRVRVPKKATDEAFPPTSPVRMTVLDPSERRITERNSSPNLGVAAQTTISRRRPSSPFRHLVHAGAAGAATSTIATSPSYRGYDTFSNSYAAGSVPPSSIPSTPTSTRSRSPSISSLETIPDSPDAEEAALEAERIAQLKAAAEAAEGGESPDSKSKNSLDVPTRGRTLGFGSRDKRKRWSVCGAERRGDIDLETIWED